MARFRRLIPPGPGSRLDPAHPLSQGMVLCLPMQEAGGGLIRDLSRSSNDLSTATGSWSPGKYGLAVGSNVNWANARATRDLPTGQNERTISALFRYTAAPVGFDASFFGYGGGGTANDFYLTRSQTFGKLGCQVHGGGSYIAWTPDTNWHVMTAYLPQGGNNTSSIVVYLDGRIPSVTIDSFGIGTSSNNLNIGGLGEPNIQIAGAWIWNRVLSLREILMHTADPFCMLEITSLFRDVQSWIDLEPRFYPSMSFNIPYMLGNTLIADKTFSIGMNLGSSFAFTCVRPKWVSQLGDSSWGDIPWGGAPRQPAAKADLQFGSLFTGAVGYQKASQCDFQFSASFIGHHDANGVFESDSLMSSLFTGIGIRATPFESDQIMSASFVAGGGRATPFSCGLQFGASFIGQASPAGINALSGEDSAGPTPPATETGSYVN